MNTSHVGLGLRMPHFEEIIRTRPELSYLEILADNYLHDDSPLLRQLEILRQHYPFIAHGVGLSIGATDPLNFNYLARIKKLLQRFDIAMYSDHLCFVSHQQRYVPELLPLPLNQNTLHYLISRVQAVQDFLGRPLILENASTYVMPDDSSMTDIAFLTELCHSTGAKILLDVNNLCVNAHNHQLALPDDLPIEHIAYLHLGGYEKSAAHSSLLIDTHGAAVAPDVWQLYERIMSRMGSLLTIIERDQHIPQLTSLLLEAEHAANIQSHYPPKATSPAKTPLSPPAHDAIPHALDDYQHQFFNALCEASPPPNVDVYQTSIRATLKATLDSIYQPFTALIGQDCFDALCYAFIDTHYPSDPVLDLYGQELSQFLTTHALQQQLPYAADYARYLFLQHQSFLAAHEPQYFTALNAEHPENIQLFCAPSMNFLSSYYPLHQIHLACIKPHTQNILLSHDIHYFYFVKTHAHLQCHLLTPSQHCLMTAIPATPDFMLVCAHYLQHFDSDSLIQDFEFLVQQQLIILKEHS